jgi:hypothetical protein
VARTNRWQAKDFLCGNHQESFYKEGLSAEHSAAVLLLWVNLADITEQPQKDDTALVHGVDEMQVSHTRDLQTISASKALIAYWIHGQFYWPRPNRSWPAGRTRERQIPGPSSTRKITALNAYRFTSSPRLPE